MRFLSDSECVAWCVQHGYATRESTDEPSPTILDFESDFHFVDFNFPNDSGKKVWLARTLYSLLDSAAELLIWLDDWDVWPSSQHMPLFRRFRESLGEHRPLIETPGHLLVPTEAEDGVSILIVALQFIWNCHVLSGSGREAVFVSHDEHGWFASRDEFTATAARRQLTR